MTATMTDLTCPKAVKVRVGCKVAWYDYRDYDDALQAQKYARHMAQRWLAEGYDYGWLIPGEMKAREDADGVWWTVTMP